ncbi:uncharacterized protein [Nicotiana tomentosiformis]|uniref:uncharacterized protein n=1 Tax=Nicotiana tomentosiformis TaxID=4098 RepID=UPI00388C9C79
MTVDMKQLQLQVFGDSKLVINHLLGGYEVKKPELVPYYKFAQRLKIREGRQKSEGEPLAFFITKINSTDDHLMECTYIIWGLMNPFKPYKKHILECKAYQFHANFIHQSPEVLYPTIASWPLDSWRLDVVSPLPKSSSGLVYILATIDYFSKWAEAVSLKEVKKENVQHNSYMYYVAANGLAEAFNKMLYNLLEKAVSNSKRDWHKRMEEAL